MNHTYGRPNVLGLTLSFLAGAVLTLGVWLVYPRQEAAQTSLRSSGSLLLPRSSSPAGNGVLQGGLLNSRSSEPNDRRVQEDSEVVGTSEFGSLLAALLDSPEEERMARLGILLGKLRRSGIAGVHWIEEYLKSAADLLNESLYGPQITKRLNGLPPFRELLTEVLLQAGERDPSIAGTVAAIGMNSARTLTEAVEFIRLAEKTSPGAYREEVLSLADRLLSKPEADGVDALNAAAVMAHFKAEELLPALEAALEAKPTVGLSEFFQALWRLPDQTRIEATQRLLGREKVGRALTLNPHLAAFVDARVPEFRASIATFFAATEIEGQRQSLLLHLESTRPSGMNPLVPREQTPEIQPGEPGSREQALGRLSLLDELAPYCDTPLLREHLNQARRELERMVTE